jgi:elongator complex protein 3
VELRLKTLSEMGHPADKIELIVMGGTFLAYPDDYQYQFIKDCYDSLNNCQSPELETAQKINETALHRCIGLCIETRPDWCQENQIKKMLEFGTTRVELGVQTLDDDIYEIVRRGHTVNDVIRATRLLKEAGIKVYYHWMPGLPGSNLEHDLTLSQKLFSDQRFRPDGLKIYPTLVIAGTDLEKWYRDNRYQPYTREEIIELMANIKSIIPSYVRISRVMRDIPTKFIVAGCKDLSLRSTIKKRMTEMGTSCSCIRCREYGPPSLKEWTMRLPMARKYSSRLKMNMKHFSAYFV